MRNSQAERERFQLDFVARRKSTRTLLLASGPLLVAFGALLNPPMWLVARGENVWPIALISSSLLVSCAGLLVLQIPRLAQLIGGTGLAAYLIITAGALIHQPKWALLLGVVGTVISIGLRRSTSVEVNFTTALPPQAEHHPRLLRESIIGSSILGGVIWLLVIGAGLAANPLGRAAGLGVFAVAILYTTIWAWRTWKLERQPIRWLLLILPLLLLTALVFLHRPAFALTWLALHQLTAVIMLEARRSEMTGWLSSVTHHPARLLVSTFLIICLTGGILLAIPPSSAKVGGIQFIDALFTSVSATCVTGLSVLDLSKDFTGFGQLVVLSLIQVGGLGIMTFSTAGVVLLGRRLGMRHERAVEGLIRDDQNPDLYQTARRILRVTFIIELIAAAALTAIFVWNGEPVSTALWRGVFTAISAFCNAGFALQSDNMMSYQHQPLVLQVVSWTIILGGLGTPVIIALMSFRQRRIPLQAKLVLTGTAILLLIPFLLITILEWNNPGTLGPMSWIDKIHNAWFQTVTPRTAGFHSIDYAKIRPETLTLSLLLMFIGGSPDSTAGGIKITTVALLTVSVIAALRSHSDATVFYRKISHESVYKSIAIMSMGTLFVLFAFSAIQLTQNLPFEMGLFEVVSALGTVGLTTGATSRLDELGKIIIMICMFAGRVGPLTLFLLLSERKREPKWIYPEEKIAVG